MNEVDYVVCLPGDPSSLIQAVNADAARASLKGKTAVRAAKSCNIYSVRNSCLNNPANETRKNQKPFEGLFGDYKKIIWIDSDSIINAAQVERLLSHDVDIVAGWYRQYITGEINDTNKAACGLKVNNVGKSYTMAEVPKLPRNSKGLIQVDYAGMGLMVVKKGVFEAMQYPWFSSWIIEWTDEKGVECAEIMTDDDCFCTKARELGFKIWIDPDVRIGHEKLAVL